MAKSMIMAARKAIKGFSKELTFHFDQFVATKIFHILK